MRQFYGLGLKVINSNFHCFARKTEWEEKARKSQGIPEGRVNLTKESLLWKGSQEEEPQSHSETLRPRERRVCFFFFLILNYLNITRPEPQRKEAIF